MIDLEKVGVQLGELETLGQKMTYLSQHYPCIYLLVLKYLKKEKRIEKYLQHCKSFENDCEKFSLYINGYWLPWLEQQRAQGKLQTGKDLLCQILVFRM